MAQYKSSYTGEEIDSGITKSNTAAQPGDDVSIFTNDAGYLTQHQDITGKEDKTNKVTSLSGSSTDTQYPSAKCVYDIIGNIESLLSEV